jgi:hypothetical protein
MRLWWAKVKNQRKERQEIKALEREVNKLQLKYLPRMNAAKAEGFEDVVLGEYIDEVSAIEPILEYKKTERLLSKARELGIDIPQDSPGWFTDSHDFYTDKTYRVFSYIGETRIRHLIRKHHREDIEWWVAKIIVPLVGLLITLLSLIVAILALRSK